MPAEEERMKKLRALIELALLDPLELTDEEIEMLRDVIMRFSLKYRLWFLLTYYGGEEDGKGFG